MLVAEGGTRRMDSDMGGDGALAERRGGWRIGEVARATGVSAKTIRYYESIGLLPRPARADNAYRRYGLADVNRLILARRIRLLGVPLTAAKALLLGTADARCAEVRADLVRLVDQRMRALDREIAELQALRVAVEGYQRALADCQPDTSASFSACLDMRCIAGPMRPETTEQWENCDDAT
jgi:DNA-binding transcriptional MerR regulator